MSVDCEDGADASFSEQDWDCFDEANVSALAKERLRDSGLERERKINKTKSIKRKRFNRKCVVK